MGKLLAVILSNWGQLPLLVSYCTCHRRTESPLQRHILVDPVQRNDKIWLLPPKEQSLSRCSRKSRLSITSLLKRNHSREAVHVHIGTGSVQLSAHKCHRSFLHTKASFLSVCFILMSAEWECSPLFLSL